MKRLIMSTTKETDQRQIEKRLAEHNQRIWKELNKPATSKNFNPDRLTSSIDFKSYGQTQNQERATTPKPMGRRILRRPESTIDECINRSVSPVPPACLIGRHKVTEQSTQHIILATKSIINELNNKDLSRSNLVSRQRTKNYEPQSLGGGKSESKAL